MPARIGVRVRFICCLSGNFTSGNGGLREGVGECIKREEGTQGESPPLIPCREKGGKDPNVKLNVKIDPCKRLIA